MTKVATAETTLYVGNLHPGIEDSRLFELFRPFGDIISCRIMRDIYSGESRGFAFVSFSERKFAENAKNALNYQKIDDWEIRICFKRSPGDFKPEANIFVKNLSLDMSAKELESNFEEFG